MLRRLAIFVLLALPAHAEGILDASPLPQYAEWLTTDFHRAFAVGPDGAWGQSSRADTPEEAERSALANCGAGCRLLARDNATVVDGRLVAPPPADQIIGRFRTEPEHLYHGPGKATGAVVWSHGTSGRPEAINMYLDPYIRRFSNAGWDVWRFDRTFGDDRLETTTRRLLDGAALLKQAGYRRVIAAGHSRGGWQSLRALAEPGPIDGVIATAPAAHGTRARGTERMAVALEEFEALFAKVAGRPRIALALFADDIFDPDPPARIAAVERHLQAKGIPYLLLAAPPGVSGHWGGFEPEFNRRYGACILGFFTRPAPLPAAAAACPPAAGQSPAAAGTRPD